jgi:hypothetical protein
MPSDELNAKEQALNAIREAHAYDLEITGHAERLVEAARRAGATMEEARSAAAESPYWPDWDWA